MFIDEAQVASLEKRMNERGYLEGSEMAGTFNMLRANDLVWSFVINNYLMGKEPFPFDLLYWNSDSTRMPAAMHSFYLRNMYLGEPLARARRHHARRRADRPLARSRRRRTSSPPSRITSRPWKSTYRGAKVLGGKVRFVLGGSGHIAGIVNPPAASKYGYWTNDAMPAEPEAWQKAATANEGSWWNDWQKWIADLNGDDRVPARAPGEGKLKVIEDAPGSYVNIRLDGGTQANCVKP